MSDGRKPKKTTRKKMSTSTKKKTDKSIKAMFPNKSPGKFKRKGSITIGKKKKK